jgi:hypothetical protein
MHIYGSEYINSYTETAQQNVGKEKWIIILQFYVRDPNNVLLRTEKI